MKCVRYGKHLPTNSAVMNPEGKGFVHAKGTTCIPHSVQKSITDVVLQERSKNQRNFNSPRLAK